MPEEIIEAKIKHCNDLMDDLQKALKKCDVKQIMGMVEDVIHKKDDLRNTIEKHFFIAGTPYSKYPKEVIDKMNNLYGPVYARYLSLFDDADKCKCKRGD